MARKNLLKGLMEPLETKSAVASPSPAPPRPAAEGGRNLKGAVGAVSQSLADLRRRAVVDLDPTLIDGAGMQDRLETDPADDARLRESLRTYGQQVPVLVRPHPGVEGRYQIVYGRRRVLALRDLGLSVKALVRELDDQELVLAQGQENTARRDLSFIEKSNFARQMNEAGYPRKIICDALNIDKTLISRMLSVAARIPEEAMIAIGSAPAIGRERWLKLAEAVDAGEWTGPEISALARGETSEDRFDAILKAVTIVERRAGEAASEAPGDSEPPGARPVREGRVLRGSDGQKFGELRRNRTRTVVTLQAGAAEGFDDWLAENLEALHRDWLARQRDG